MNITDIFDYTSDETTSSSYLERHVKCRNEPMIPLNTLIFYMSLRMRKPTICICENKDADQLCSNCTADQCLCFRHTDSKIPLILKSKVSSLSLYSVTVQPWLVSDLVGYPNCWFSCAQAHIRNRKKSFRIRKEGIQWPCAI